MDNKYRGAADVNGVRVELTNGIWVELTVIRRSSPQSHWETGSIARACNPTSNDDKTHVPVEREQKVYRTIRKQEVYRIDKETERVQNKLEGQNKYIYKQSGGHKVYRRN